MLDILNEDARIKGDCNDNDTPLEIPYKCSQCGDELTDSYWYCYYSGDVEENRVCGEGTCWADWIQYNMEEVIIEEDEE